MPGWGESILELAELSRLIERSARSAFRLEALPQYLVPQEAEELAEWQSGLRRPLATTETSPWLARIKSGVDTGYRWQRARVLDYPLSEYSEFELHGYQANYAAGEEIGVADRRWSADLLALHEDFWLIDDEIAVRMIYDELGHFVRPELVEDAREFVAIKALVLHHCVDLMAYLREWEPRLIA
jgi:hypothetical protein